MARGHRVLCLPPLSLFRIELHQVPTNATYPTQVLARFLSPCRVTSDRDPPGPQTGEPYSGPTATSRVLPWGLMWGWMILSGPCYQTAYPVASGAPFP